MKINDVENWVLPFFTVLVVLISRYLTRDTPPVPPPVRARPLLQPTRDVDQNPHFMERDGTVENDPLSTCRVRFLRAEHSPIIRQFPKSLSIATIKHELFHDERIIMVYLGQILQDDKTFEDYQIEDDAAIILQSTEPPQVNQSQVDTYGYDSEEQKLWNQVGFGLLTAVISLFWVMLLTNGSDLFNNVSVCCLCLLTAFYAYVCF